MTKYSSQIADNLITQYKESGLMIGLISNLATSGDELIDVIEDVKRNRYIDTAVEVQLDILGVILGQPREVVDTVLLGIFGFEPDLGSDGFGDSNDPTAGGRFRSYFEGTVTKRFLLDHEYRYFLHTRIYKNVTDCSPDQLIRIVKDVMSIDGGDFDLEFADGNTYYTFYIGKVLSDNERYFIISLDLLPRTAGVNAYYIEYEPDEYFGFDEDPNAKGFVDEADPDSPDGGILSNWITVIGGLI